MQKHATVRRRNRVYKSLHKPLTYLGVERTLFYFVCVGAVGAFNLFNSLVAGTIFFIGESTGYGPGGTADPIITSTLATLGSTMTMAGNDGTVYPVSATVLANALTAGVSSFNYGFTSFVTGGTALFNTQGGSPFIAVQTVGAATPEPVTGLMTLGGLAGLGLLARRKRS